MALSSPFVVRVEKKPEHSFGSTMSGIRTWLDHHKIQVVSFKPFATAETGVGFEIAFRTEDEAHLFEREFAKVTRPSGYPASPTPPPPNPE